MRRKKSFLRVALGVFIVTTLLVTATAFVDKYYYVDKKLVAIESIIKDYYVGDVDESKLQEGIYRGFVSGVGDLYTSYYSPEEFKSFQETANGVYGGIGVSMSIDNTDNSIVVTDVMHGTPAEKVGMKVDDKIIKAAGKSVNGDDFETLPTIIKGEVGTDVEVTVYRPSEEKDITFTLTRGTISVQTVESKMLQDDLGYIKISRFEKVTYDQFKAALQDIEAKQAKGLIIDLRNNPGGLLDVTEKIADELVPKGIVVSTKDKNGKSVEYYADDKYTDIPIVVLVNGNSASASEVLAGALKDYKRAKLVGETTFGKGIVQSVVPLRDGSALKLTTAQYFTPSGVCIHGIGIDPDYRVSLTTKEVIKGASSEAEDTQLKKAIEVLKQSIK